MEFKRQQYRLVYLLNFIFRLSVAILFLGIFGNYWLLFLVGHFKNMHTREKKLDLWQQYSWIRTNLFSVVLGEAKNNFSWKMSGFQLCVCVFCVFKFKMKKGFVFPCSLNHEPWPLPFWNVLFDKDNTLAWINRFSKRKISTFCYKRKWKSLIQ